MFSKKQFFFTTNEMFAISFQMRENNHQMNTVHELLTQSSLVFLVWQTIFSTVITIQ